MPLIAAIQAGTAMGNNTATLEKLRRHCLACAERGVKLAVAPEAFIGGYPKGMQFGASMGIRTDAGRMTGRADDAVRVQPEPLRKDSSIRDWRNSRAISSAGRS